VKSSNLAAGSSNYNYAIVAELVRKKIARIRNLTDVPNEEPKRIRD
jgi:hypothetical protein